MVWSRDTKALHRLFYKILCNEVRYDFFFLFQDDSKKISFEIFIQGLNTVRSYIILLAVVVVIIWSNISLDIKQSVDFLMHAIVKKKKAFFFIKRLFLLSRMQIIVTLAIFKMNKILFFLGSKSLYFIVILSLKIIKIKN